MKNRGARIKHLRKAAGFSQERLAAELSRLTGEDITRGAVGNWELNKGIGTDNLIALARLLKSSVAWIVDGAEDRHEVDSTGTGSPLQSKVVDADKNSETLSPEQNHEPNARIAGPSPMHTRVKAYGHAMGGEDGEFILNGNEMGDVLAPPSLQGVANAYAVYVAGDSMEPRYDAGEVVFVNPQAPVRKGDYVVAQIAGKDGEPPLAYVKRFVWELYT